MANKAQDSVRQTVHVCIYEKIIMELNPDKKLNYLTLDACDYEDMSTIDLYFL